MEDEGEKSKCLMDRVDVLRHPKPPWRKEKNQREFRYGAKARRFGEKAALVPWGGKKTDEAQKGDIGAQCRIPDTKLGPPYGCYLARPFGKSPMPSGPSRLRFFSSTDHKSDPSDKRKKEFLFNPPFYIFHLSFSIHLLNFLPHRFHPNRRHNSILLEVRIGLLLRTLAHPFCFIFFLLFTLFFPPERMSDVGPATADIRSCPAEDGTRLAGTGSTATPATHTTPADPGRRRRGPFKRGAAACQRCRRRKQKVRFIFILSHAHISRYPVYRTSISSAKAPSNLSFVSPSLSLSLIRNIKQRWQIQDCFSFFFFSFDLFYYFFHSFFLFILFLY